MTKVLAVCFYYFCFFRATTTHRFSCSKNEILQRCKKPCQPTCQNSYVSLCSVYDCKPGCVCKPGSLRDELSGICVNQQYCLTDCPHNEIPNNIGNGCEPTCQYSRVECGSQIKRCICRPGMVRDVSSGKCISFEECSKILSCKENEVWKECSDENCRATCRRRKPNVCPTTCKAGCSCKYGYLWDEHLNKCVSKFQCSKVCAKNEDWCRQLPDYIPTCQSIMDPECRNCNDPLPEGPRSGCICRKQFIWDEVSQQCVRLEKCHTSTLNVTSTTTEVSRTATSGTTITSTSVNPFSKSSTSSTSSTPASTTSEFSSTSPLSATECTTSTSKHSTHSSTATPVITSSSSSTPISSAPTTHGTTEATTIAASPEISSTSHYTTRNAEVNTVHVRTFTDAHSTPVKLETIPLYEI